MDINICKCTILPITKKRNTSVFIIPSFVILLNVLMTMSIFGFQFHMILIEKSIAIRSLKSQIKLLACYIALYLHVPKKW